jgi:hypothetical protein
MNLEALFLSWNAREPKSDACQVKTSSSQLELDSNSRRLLNNILLTNKKYMKQEIPSNILIDSETGTIEEIDILDQITPFTTDKTDLYARSKK